MFKSILSRPGAELRLPAWMADWSSESEKGQSSCLLEWKIWGKLGTKQEGGQMEGKRSIILSMVSTLLGWVEGSIKFLFRKRLILAHRTPLEERELSELVKLIQDCFFADRKLCFAWASAFLALQKFW